MEYLPYATAGLLFLLAIRNSRQANFRNAILLGSIGAAAGIYATASATTTLPLVMQITAAICAILALSTHFYVRANVRKASTWKYGLTLGLIGVYLVLTPAAYILGVILNIL